MSRAKAKQKAQDWKNDPEFMKELNYQARENAPANAASLGIIMATPVVGLMGSAIDSFTGDTSLVQGNGEGEIGQNLLSGTGWGLAGAGIGGGIAHLTRDRGYQGDNNALKKEAQEVMKKEGETAGKKFFSDNKNRVNGRVTGRDLANNAARTLRGAAIGAAASLVPTLMGMRDQEQLAEQSASLM